MAPKRFPDFSFLRQGGKPKMFLSETLTGKQLPNDILMTEVQQLVLENNGFINRKKALRKEYF